MRRPIRSRRSRRGVTLIEMMIGSAIGLFLTGAAVMFATHETRLLGFSSERMELQQSGRAAVDTLTADIQAAGVGLGYQTDGRFIGLQTGSFIGLGGAGFNTEADGSNTIQLRAGIPSNPTDVLYQQYYVKTEDLGILTSQGPHATVASYSSLGGEFCDAEELFGDDQMLVVLRTEDMLAGYSTLFTPTSGPGPCTYGQCAPLNADRTAGFGCRQFSLTTDNDAVFRSESSASGLSYGSGEVHGNLKQVIWFVRSDADDVRPEGRGTLRRAELDQNARCPDRNDCGADFAFNTETLQYEVWMFDPDAIDSGATTNIDERWINVVQDGATDWVGRDGAIVNSRSRIRVDVEFVIRQQGSDNTPHAAVGLALRPDTCLPSTGNCTGLLSPAADHVYRQAYRFSVEVRNSGRMDMRPAR